jgi:hypothetical protein
MATFTLGEGGWKQAREEHAIVPHTLIAKYSEDSLAAEIGAMFKYNSTMEV